MSDAIKISQLTNLSEITSDDFFPIVDSGSMTTYRSFVSTLGTWMVTSGSIKFATSSLSSSYASSSLSSSYSLTGSYALTSSYSLSGSYVLTASYALTSSFSTITSASYALTSSYSLTGSYALTSSYSLTGSYVLTGSYALTSSFAISASNMVSASYSITSSYASTSSYSLTGSYALTSSYSLTGSYVLTGSYALTSSYSLSGSYALSSSRSLTSSFSDKATSIIGGGLAVTTVDSSPINTILSGNPNWGVSWNNGSLFYQGSPTSPCVHFTVSHPLGRVPVYSRIVLLCTASSLGYSTNDEIDLVGSVLYTTLLPVPYSSFPGNPRNQVTYNTTTIYFTNVGGFYLYPKTPVTINDLNPSFMTLTDSAFWKIRFYLS